MFDVQLLHIKHSGRLEVLMQRKIGIDIHRLDNRIRRYVQRSVTQYEMEAVSGTNGRIVRFLSEHADRDVYQKDLESEFGITRSTASRVLRLMEQKGLVERQSVPHDARLKKLLLTERSRKLVQQMCQTGTTVDTRLLSGFSSQEVQTLYGFLDRMFQNLE